MNLKIRTVILGSVLTVSAFVSACDKEKSATAASDDSADEPKGSLEARVDKHGEEIMASTAKAEACQWMKQPSHIFLKADPKEVAQFVEDFYGAGATQVLIADIEEQDGKQFGEALLVVLPKVAAARRKSFEVGVRADIAFQNDEVSDKGQKYLYYSLD